MKPGGAHGGILVPDATNDQWNRYYDDARQRRHIMGGDVFERFWARRAAHERRLFIGSCLLFGVVLATFYTILIR
jgi:hypothetical protein